jgi:hypothetical protein
MQGGGGPFWSAPLALLVQNSDKICIFALYVLTLQPNKKEYEKYKNIVGNYVGYDLYGLLCPKG